MSKTDYHNTEALLIECGWTLARMRKHPIYRCPCGKHQTPVCVSPSDHRAQLNLRSQLRRLECPSLKGKL